MQELERPDLPVHFSVTLSFSGIKVTPSSVCSLPLRHTSLLPFTAPHIQLALIAVHNLIRFGLIYAQEFVSVNQPWSLPHHNVTPPRQRRNTSTFLSLVWAAKYENMWHSREKYVTVASQTIFYEQIRDQIVWLIVKMWNSLPQLLLCIFWQALLQLKHRTVRLSSGSLGSCVAECMFVQNVQQWALWGCCSVKKVHEQLQGFHLGLSHLEEWNIFCRKQTNKQKRIIVQAVTVILNSEMRGSHLPLLSLCQCCHRDKGKQRKGMCVVQKPTSHVCSFNRSAPEARHFQTQQFYTKQKISNIHPHVISSCDGCSPSHTLTSVLHRCSHGLHAACCQ